MSLSKYATTKEKAHTQILIHLSPSSSHSKLKVVVSGGLTRNELYMQLHADILNCEITSMKTQEADGMLLGMCTLSSFVFYTHLKNKSY